LFENIYSGQANFLLARLANDGDGYQLQTQLDSSRIFIRICGNFAGLDKSRIHFAVNDEQSITQLANSFKLIK
jgi:threonine-phosphate decarboxylase